MNAGKRLRRILMTLALAAALAVCGVPAAAVCGVPAAVACSAPTLAVCSAPATAACGAPALAVCSAPATAVCGVPAAAVCGVPAAVASYTSNASGPVFHDSADDAAAELRRAMMDRRESVTIGLTGSTADEETLKKAIGELMKKAVEHTGNPKEGDYINFQYASYEGSAETTIADGEPAVKIEYRLSYYDSAKQEAEEDRKVKEILDELDLDDKTDYEKTAAIYDYLCENTEYEAAEDGDDIRRTAYGALVEKKAVCQGYSLALYRLLLEAGVDNRIIFGTGIDPGGSDGAHTWNIVRLYGKYYYVDATWDDSTGSRDHFLKPAGSVFEDTHVADDEYPDDFFTEQYPMADTEFNGEVKAVSKTIIWCVERLEKAIFNKANAEAGKIF